MAYVDFLTTVHTSTKRNYIQRVVEHDKARCAEIACRFDRDYWDGERHVGYGGYCYDGRWRRVAEAMVAHYGLKPGDRILDVGCGKAFLLYEFTQVLPGCEIAGIDLSSYAVENAKEEARPFLRLGDACDLSCYESNSFDFVFSINTLHNLYLQSLWPALEEIERVGKNHKHITVEGYRTEAEKVNLMYWQLTCRGFHTPTEWEFLFEKTRYSGDYGLIFFE